MNRDPIPPQDIQAEASTLGSMILAVEAIPAVAEVVKAEDFYRPGHGVIYNALLAMHATATPIDLVTLAHKLEAENALAQATEGRGREYLSELAEVPSAANAAYYADIVRECSRRRHAIGIAARLREDAFTGEGEAAADLLGRYGQELLDAAGDLDSHHGATLAQAVDDVLAGAHRLTQNREADPTVATGLLDLDRALGGGFSPGDLVTLGGETGAGKSTLAASIAANVAERRGAVVYVSAEMLPRELGRRFLAAASGVFSSKLKTGWSMSQVDWQEAELAASKLRGWRLYLHCRASTVGEIALAARRLRAQWGKLSLVIVDYLQLMTPSGGDTRAQQVSGIAWGLKRLAMDLSCPVVMISQLNRAGVVGGHPPSMFSLKESGDLENHSNTVLLVHRPTNGAAAGDGLETWLRIAKARDGAATPWEGAGALRLAWQPGLTRFTQWGGQP